jgi:WD40 repeat protein/tetratricopeptide (TPR) repeat protein
MKRSRSVSSAHKASRTCIVSSAETAAVSGLGKRETTLDTKEITPAVTWRVGDTIFDHYLVTEIRGVDPSGTTYQVHHLDWDIDLMVKCPHPDVFAHPEGRMRFLSEAETWVTLPLHPHIVSGYYVLLQGALPALFAEDVAGGSLADWIRDARLYQGGHQAALERMLTIAIHCAWGLHAAHEAGMIHQAFSADQTRLTAEGVAKVMGFRQQPAGEHAADRQRDIEDWAVSLLEMFVGAVHRQDGAAMLQEVMGRDATHDSAIPPMPSVLAQVLTRCLEPHLAPSPANLLTLATELQAIFAQELGRPFLQVFPQAVRLLPHTLNNRALSLYSLDKIEAAKRLWDQALQDDPFHLEATYNRGVALWRSGELTDDVVVRQLEAVRATESAQRQGQRWFASYLLAQVHLERGDREAALQAFQQARQEAPTQRWHTELSQQERTLSQELQASQRQPTQRILDKNWQDAIVALSADGSRAILATGKPLRAVEHKPGFWCFWELGKEPHQVDITHWKRDKKMASMRVNSISMRADGSEVLFGGFDVYYYGDGDDRHHPMVALLGFRKRRRGFGIGLSGLFGEQIASVRLSADGKRALIGGPGGLIGLWKVGTKLRLPIRFGRMDGVTAVDLSADGRWAAAAGSGRVRRLLPLKWWRRERRPVIQVWNTRTWRRVQLPQEDFVRAISLSADGRWLLSSCGATLRLWEVATGRCVRVLRDQSGFVQTVSLSADGSLALSGSGSEVRVWDLAQGRCLRTLQGHEGPVISVGLSADGQVGISCGQSVRLWRIERSNFRCALSPSPIVPSEESRRLATHASQILSQAQHAREEGRFSAAVALMRELRALPGYERLPEVRREWETLTRLGLRTSLQGAWLLTTVQGDHSAVESVALSADGSQAIALSGGWQKKTASFWDVETGQCLHTVDFAERRDPLSPFRLNADGSRAFSVSYDSIGIWDVKTGRLLRLFQHHAQKMYDDIAVHLSMDGRWLISASDTRDVHVWQKATARVWDVETGSCVAILSGPFLSHHRDAAVAVSLSPDGRWAITGSGDDGSARVWDVIQGRCTHVLPRTNDWFPISDVALSADGHTAAITGAVHPMRVWDVMQERCVGALPSPTRLVNLSVDGNWAITAGNDTIGIWDIVQMRCVSTLPLPGHRAGVTSMMVSPDGQRVIYGRDDGTIQVWQLDWEMEVSDAADWDERARSYLEAFLILHTPYTTALPLPDQYSAEVATQAVTRQGMPVWTEEDFQGLIHQLQYAGYGWLRVDGVRKHLEQMRAGRGG